MLHVYPPAQRPQPVPVPVTYGAAEKSVSLGVAEIVLRIICLVSSFVYSIIIIIIIINCFSVCRH